MRFISIILVFIFISCEAGLDNQEVIEFTKKSKFFVPGKESGLTVEETASGVKKEFSKRVEKFNWKIKKVEDKDIYIVGYVSNDGNNGLFWETNYLTKQVSLINGNPLLEDKYGMRKNINKENFSLHSISKDELIVKVPKGYYNELGIVQVLKGKVENLTDKLITNSKIQVNLEVVFSENKIVKVSKNPLTGINGRINTKNPWRPGTSIIFNIETEPIDRIYLNYEASHAKFKFYIEAEDPIGNKFTDLIYERNINWNELVRKLEKSKNNSSIEKNSEQAKDHTTSLQKTERESKEGNLNYGFEIDFGDRGKRKIYSYTLPPYPKDISKEIDVKLRFTILPDGSVGKIFPLIKGDARLESAATNSLRQWKFEPLEKSQKQVEQTAVITFPFRLQ